MYSITFTCFKLIFLETTHRLKSLLNFWDQILIEIVTKHADLCHLLLFSMESSLWTWWQVLSMDQFQDIATFFSTYAYIYWNIRKITEILYTSSRTKILKAQGVQWKENVFLFHIILFSQGGALGRGLFK